MTAGLPPELVEAIDKLDTAGRSTRVIALATGVSQSTVSRRRRARRRAEIREALLSHESDSRRKNPPGDDLPWPVLRSGAQPEIRLTRDSDQGSAEDYNHCWLCQREGTVWGRCPGHSEGRDIVWLLAAYGLSYQAEDYPPVPHGGFGPVEAAILTGSGHLTAVAA